MTQTTLGSAGDSFPPKQCYEPDTYYQILEVRPPNEKEKRVGKNIATTIVAKQRGTGKDYSTDKKTFDNYKIDSKTKEKLKDYYPDIKSDKDKLSSYLSIKIIYHISFKTSELIFTKTESML